jgi:hypothetical protein
LHLFLLLLLVVLVVLVCVLRWRNFLSPNIAHPRKNPFTDWEVAVVVRVRTFVLMGMGVQDSFPHLQVSLLHPH